jgi:hypothetical protein
MAFNKRVFHLARTNRCKAHFQVKEYNAKNSMKIEQLNEGSSILKNHYMKVAFFDVLGEATIVELYMKNEGNLY